MNLADSGLIACDERSKCTIYVSLVSLQSRALRTVNGRMHVIGFIKIIDRFVHEFLIIFTFWK